MAGRVLNVPRELRRGSKSDDQATLVASGATLIDLMCRQLQLPDLGNSAVLDMGCGCKLVQAILQNDLAVGRYVGVDVFPELIDFLRSEVHDPRFQFEHMNSHNAMYNPEGEPLDDDTRLNLQEASFDVICLYSVFTHLAPHDYAAMLKLLRRYIKPGGRLIYSLFLNEASEDGLGFWDGVIRDWNKNAEQIFAAADVDVEAAKSAPQPDFIDWNPAKPLKWAVYSREHALELVAGTGWQVESLNPPEPEIQHYMICKPVDAGENR